MIKEKTSTLRCSKCPGRILLTIGLILFIVHTRAQSVNFETRFQDTLLFQRDVTVKDSSGNGFFVQPKVSFQLKKRKYWKRRKNSGEITSQFYYSFVQNLDEIIGDEMLQYPSAKFILEDKERFRKVVEKKYRKALKKEKVKVLDLNFQSFDVYSYIERSDSAKQHFVRRLVGFSFDVPASWRYNPNGFCKFSDSTYLAKNGLDGMSFKVKVNYQEQVSSPGQYYQERGKAILPKEKVDSVWVSKLNGKKTVIKKSHFDINYYGKTKVLKALTYYTLQRKYPVELTFSYYEGSEKEAEEIMKQILNSFVLED